VNRDSAKRLALTILHSWRRQTALAQPAWRAMQGASDHDPFEDARTPAMRRNAEVMAAWRNHNRNCSRKFEVKMWLIYTISKMFLFTFMSWMFQAVEQHSGKGQVNWLIVAMVWGATAFWQLAKGFKKFVP
jgi:hypothetical protein